MSRLKEGFIKRAYNTYGGQTTSFNYGGPANAFRSGKTEQGPGVQEYTVGGIAGATAAAKGSQAFKKKRAIDKAKKHHAEVKKNSKPAGLFENAAEKANKAELARKSRKKAMVEARENKSLFSSLRKGFGTAKTKAAGKPSNWKPQSYFSKIKPKSLLKLAMRLTDPGEHKGSFYLAFGIKGEPDYNKEHITHTYFGKVDGAAELGEILSLCGMYFDENPFREFEFNFDQEDMFGPGKDVRVVRPGTPESESSVYLSALRKALMPYNKSKFKNDEYKPHITTNKKTVKGVVDRIALLSGNQEVRVWKES